MTVVSREELGDLRAKASSDRDLIFHAEVVRGLLDHIDALEGAVARVRELVDVHAPYVDVWRIRTVLSDGTDDE